MANRSTSKSISEGNRMPLKGVRVIELGAWAFGPHVGVHLANMGADVIKVERPSGGDPGRGLVGVFQLPVGEFNYFFDQSNHNKKSIAVDLSQEKGREIIHKLVPASDVFLTNFRSDALERVRMDYTTLSQMNSKLIYALASGWGLKGPDKDLAAFDYTIFARAGLALGFAEPDASPVFCLPALGDYIAAMTMAYGVMLALFDRERTGEGQMVHTSLLGSVSEAASLCIGGCLSAGQDLPHISRKSVSNPFWNYYQCQDGKWIALTMVQSDVYWHDICEALELERLEKDARFDTHSKRWENNIALISILDEVFSTRPGHEWIKRFEGRNIIWGQVQGFQELGDDPQFLENDYIIPFEHPSIGSVKVPGNPVQLSKAVGQARVGAPELGQHTEEILQELGYTWDDIAGLKDQKVIL